MNEHEIENKINEKGLNAPRLTPDHIDERIRETHFLLLPGTTTTLCYLILQNGHTVVGTSACVSPENFNSEIGEQVALKNAREKIWELEGYLLQQRLFEQA